MKLTLIKFKHIYNSNLFNSSLNYKSKLFSSKLFNSAKEAVADIKSGSLILVGGFGVCGIPESLISAVKDSGVNNLEVVSNDSGSWNIAKGVKPLGLGLWLENGQIKRMVSSFLGENEEMKNHYIAGKVELQLIP